MEDPLIWRQIDGFFCVKKLTGIRNCDMLSLYVKNQKVLLLRGRKGNQVQDLNDPVTVNGSDIRYTHCHQVRRADEALNRKSGNLLSV